MDIPIVRPESLCAGDTIAIVAPAGPVEQRNDFERGVAALERMGFRVRFDERIFQSTGYLAGNDPARAAELMGAFEDPSVKAIVALRGGYGCSRLIDLLDEGRLRRHCKVFMGFSDLTTLHLHFRRRYGWLTFHGPMATSPALGNIGPEEEGHLLSLWTDPCYLPDFSFPDLAVWAQGFAEGELTGGCLSLVAASLGTPYEIDTEGKILFLEDLGEPPYRIDRMLTQLRLARKLERIAGVLLGRFKDCEAEKPGTTSADVLREILTKLEVPVIANFPAGHGNENWALPLGSRIRLDTDTCRVRFLDPAVSPFK
jgi:muramoyltetrapeptide carboxypeptidase